MGGSSGILGAYGDEGTIINWEALCDEGRGGSRLRLQMRLYGERLCTLIHPGRPHEGDDYSVIFSYSRFEQLDSIPSLLYAEVMNQV